MAPSQRRVWHTVTVARSVLGYPAMSTLPVVIRPGEDGWIIAECPVIPGCISQGRTRDGAIANIREAIVLCLEAGEGEKQ